MVEVFKTNITKKRIAQEIRSYLSDIFPAYDINFDLNDCDNILRVEASLIDGKKVIESVKHYRSEIFISVLEE